MSEPEVFTSAKRLVCPKCGGHEFRCYVGDCKPWDEDQTVPLICDACGAVLSETGTVRWEEI